MQSHSLSSGHLSWTGLKYSTPPTTHSSKLFTELNVHSDPPILTIQSSQWSPGQSSTGLQRQPKKDLSRILRTEAAIKAIEQKANSKKYTNLWPKAVLEALDEAIRDKHWESALKVCGLFVLRFLRTSSCWPFCFFVLLMKLFFKKRIMFSVSFCISSST